MACRYVQGCHFQRRCPSVRCMAAIIDREVLGKKGKVDLCGAWGDRGKHARPGATWAATPCKDHLAGFPPLDDNLSMFQTNNLASFWGGKRETNFPVEPPISYLDRMNERFDIGATLAMFVRFRLLCCAIRADDVSDRQALVHAARHGRALYAGAPRKAGHFIYRHTEGEEGRL